MDQFYWDQLRSRNSIIKSGKKLGGRQHYFDVVPTWLKMPWLLLSLLLAYVISPDWKYIVHALNYYTFRKDKQMTDMVQNQRKKDRENFLEK
jgi:hypothetical protein